jgi:hypothetical protein
MLAGHLNDPFEPTKKQKGSDSLTRRNLGRSMEKLTLAAIPATSQAVAKQKVREMGAQRASLSELIRAARK